MALQEALNPKGEGLRRSGFVYRPNDKVMQIKNNYDKEVFNGDIGIIESVDLQDRTLLVNFDGRSIEYDATELDELVHAYATTIHKSAGLRVSYRGHAGTDESFCYAAEKPDLYRDYQSKADTCYGRNEEGTGLCSTECNRNQEKYTS